MKLFSIIFSVLLCLSSTTSVLATSLLPINLEQLSTRASLIFYGSVITNQVKKDLQSGHIVTLTEFKVIDLIKGNTSGKHTIKQIGGHLKENNISLRVHGVPEYETGKHYVIFLPKKSRLGFSSPLGLHQGSFSVSTIDGMQIISNGQNLATPQQGSEINRVLNIPLAVNIDNPSQARLTDFINTVRAYNVQ